MKRPNALKSFLYTFLSAGVLSVALYSCNDEPLVDNIPTISDDAIRIGAGVGKLNSTRDYISDGYGQVNSGTFTLSYPYYYGYVNSALGTLRFQCQLAEVTFGYPGQEEIGFVNAANPSTDPPKDLVWSRLNNSSNDGIYVFGNQAGATLYLDNVPKPTSSATTDSIVTFTDAKYADCATRFAAAQYAEDGSNDLLWGESFVQKGSQFINFSLQHCLTRLRLNVIVNESETETNGFDITLDNASVRINDLLLRPYTFDRHHGTIEFMPNTNTSYNEQIWGPKNFWLVGSKGNSDTSEASDPSDFSSTWQSKTMDATGKITTYKTFDFVLPPQSLKTGSNRQKLIIRIPKDDYQSGLDKSDDVQEQTDSVTFWAYIPSSMYQELEGGGKVSQNLNLIRGYDITLTTSMVPGQAELEFMPVTVEEWVNKGEFNPKADQNGIPSAEAFYQMMEYYEDYNAFQLTRYGFLNSKGVWDFQFRGADIALEQTKVAGKMMRSDDKPDFIPDFRNRNELLILPDGTQYGLARLGNEGQGQLYTILTTEPNSGIKESAWFTEGYTNKTENNGNVVLLGLIDAYQQNSWELGIYGEYTKNAPKPWTFTISGDLTLDYDEIATQMLVREGADFSFKIPIELTVKVKNMPGTTDEETVSAEQLYQIVSTRLSGLYNTQDFMNMIAAFNQTYTRATEGQLDYYGTQNGSTWTFPIWRNNIKVNRRNIQGMMQTSDNDVSYTFNFRKNTLIITEPDETSTSLTSKDGDEKLVAILSGPKLTGVNTAAAFAALAEAFAEDSKTTNTALTEYGYVTSGEWIFEISRDLSLEYGQIAGVMAGGTTDFSFQILSDYTITITYGDDTEPLVLEGSNGAGELYEIVTTTIPQPEPTPDPTPDPDPDGN